MRDSKIKQHCKINREGYGNHSSIIRLCWQDEGQRGFLYYDGKKFVDDVFSARRYFDYELANRVIERMPASWGCDNNRRRIKEYCVVDSYESHSQVSALRSYKLMRIGKRPAFIARKREEKKFYTDADNCKFTYNADEAYVFSHGQAIHTRQELAFKVAMVRADTHEIIVPATPVKTRAYKVTKKQLRETAGTVAFLGAIAGRKL